MQNEIVKPTQSRGSYRWLSLKVRLGILGVTLLLAGAMGAAALTYLMPRSPNRAQSFTDRLAWYLHDGRLHADMHTLASMIEYIVTSESQLPNVTVSTNPPVAGNAATTSSKS